MATMAESEISMLSSQYMQESLTFFLQDSSSGAIELDELERRLFLDNDLDNDLDTIAATNLEGEDILTSLPLHYNSAQAKAFDPSSSPVARSTSLSKTVSEELNSLSLDQMIAAGSSSPHFNKRMPPSPLASPKKTELPSPVVDCKDGILRPTGLFDDFSAMGSLVYGHGDSMASSKKPCVIQRSYSSHALGQLPSIRSSSGTTTSALDSTMQGLHACSGSIVPSLSQLLEVKEGEGSFEIDVMASPSSAGCYSPCSSNSMRRVCSTGDIQRMNTSLHTEGQDECGFKIGRYSLAERKERIHRYRLKRSERNFNKKIKYACRKTLADSRPRVRGRFAKNEDVVDSSSRHSQSKANKAGGEYEDEVDALLEDDENLLIDRQSSGELSECWARIGRS